MCLAATGRLQGWADKLMLCAMAKQKILSHPGRFKLLPPCTETVAICGGRDFEAPTYHTVTIWSKCTKL